MIRSAIMRRHLITTLVLVLLFLVLGFFTSRFIGQLMMMSSARMAGMESPPVSLAKLIDRLDPLHRENALKIIQDEDHPNGPQHLAIVDDRGHDLRTGEIVPNWDKIKKPEIDYQSAVQGHFEPGLGGGPPPIEMIRFKGNPPQFLYATFDPSHGPPMRGVISVTFASLVISVLLGVGISSILLYRNLHETVGLIDSVIADLQGGNLKARFPIKKMDEIGQAMTRFNRMADEIERLVSHLQRSEQSRIVLLQDLAHDLRTPLASLKNLLETLHIKKDSLSNSVRDEFFNLSLREIDYFERLVEDLLVLAQMSEPHYKAERRLVSLSALIEQESESIRSFYRNEGKEIKLVSAVPEGALEIVGDSHLLKRMLRNILDNAFSFARTQVEIELRLPSSSAVEIQVRDDGPGFSASALSAYGERRASRVLGSTRGSTGQTRLSVGLGSVIIKTVAYAHRGTVAAENREEGGAQITVSLPKA